MLKGSSGLLVWIALFCSLLLPLTAMGEVRGHQLEPLGCCLPDCHGDCCPMTTGHFSGCHGCSGFMPCLASDGVIIYHQQVSSHRFERITPTFKAFPSDIFHPPKLGSSLV